MRLCRLAAEQGHAMAQNNLGTRYAEGRGGLPRCSVEATRLWQLAADQGSVEARNNLRGVGARRWAEAALGGAALLTLCNRSRRAPEPRS